MSGHERSGPPGPRSTGGALRPFHAVLVLPVIALLGTPFFPFVNTAAPWFGLPSVVVWVCGWCVLTSLLLAWVLRREEAAGLISGDDPDGPDDPADPADPADPVAERGGKVDAP
ncbi:hypothetical protein ABZ805_14475 [Saccharopolyspora sp. NPDC047091]|uniref:hypothetical protein n=1 Tax=Saccharopolyspora sp. NPDC047091 TaxID=3155924 RepID=UPI0033D2B8D3